MRLLLRQERKRGMKDKGKSIAKRRTITSFICLLILSVICVGVVYYFYMQKQAGMEIDETMVQIIKIVALLALFFFVMAFLQVLPKLFSKNKFADEDSMKKAFSKYIDMGETLEAGVYATAIESCVIVLYRKCRYVSNKLIRDEKADLFDMEKRKYSKYEVYLGVTDKSLLVVECDKNKHYYGHLDKIEVPLENIPELKEEIDESDVGVKFSLKEIAKVESKKAKKGNILCTITMKNGSYFKIMLPDNVGVKSDMPNHYEYRKKILSLLKAAK